MDEIIRICANYVIFLSIALVPLLFARLPASQRKNFALTLILSGILAYVFAKIGSHLYYDARPFVRDGSTALIGHSNDNGFPSDHMLLASLIACVTLIYSRKIGAIAAALAVIVAVGRVAAGVHHAVDMLGSVAFAVFGVLVAGYAIRFYLVRKSTTDSKIS